MGWNYDYRVGPRGGTLLQLSTVCVEAHIVGDGSGTGQEGDDADVQYLHGERVNPTKYTAAGLITLVTTFRDTNSSGAITHADGATGHWYENIAAVKKIMYTPRNMVTLQRIAPHQGTVQVDCQLIESETIGEVEWRLVWPLKVADPPFWKSTTLNTGINPVPTVVVGGNAPADDVEVTFSDGDMTLTHTASGRMVGLAGAPSGGTLNCRTGAVANGGTSLSQYLINSHEDLLQLDGGETNAFSVSGGTVTIAWRNKWRL